MEVFGVAFAARGVQAAPQAVIMPRFKIAWNIIGLLMYVIDLTTDIYAAVQHYARGGVVDVWFGQLTVGFIMLPMALSSMMCIDLVIKHCEWPVLVKCLLMPLCIVGAPIAPFILLVRSIVTSIRGQDPDDTAIRAAGNVKLTEAIGESLPQAWLQLLNIFWYLFEEKTIDSWQWLTIATSLIALSFAAATKVALNDAATSSKAMFFFVGLLASASRLVVWCMFVVLVPLLSEWFAYFAVNLIRNMSGIYFKWVMHGEEGHQIPGTRTASNVLHKCVHTFLTSLLSIPCDSFSLCGLPVSGINLVFAVRAYCVGVPQHMAIVSIVTMTLAITSFAANVILTATPHFRYIGEDWLLGLDKW